MSADRKDRGYSFADEGFLARLERLHLIAKRLAARGPAGPRRSRRLGDGLEFADHRDYSPGDDIRFIDWPYYARMERLLLRMFHEHSEAAVAILLDCSASMAPGVGEPGGPAWEKFHHARRVAAALACVAMGGLDRVVIRPFADSLAEPMIPGRSRARLPAVLGFLDGLVPEGMTNLRHGAERLARKWSSPAGGAEVGTVLLISDLLDCGEDLSEALVRLGVAGGRDAGRDVVVVQVYSPADRDPDLGGPVVLRHAETHGPLRVDVTEDLLAAYRRRFERFLDDCRRTCLSRLATYAEAPTDVPFQSLVLNTLRRAGVLTG